MNDKKQWDLKSLRNIKTGNLRKDHLFILLLAGLLLLVISIPTEKSKERDIPSDYERQGKSASSGTDNGYAAYLERHLEELFSQMEGAGETSVMVTLASSAEKVVEKDVERESEQVTETDSQGGVRTTKNSSGSEVTVYDGKENEEGNPYVRKEMTPKVEGVVVIASGGDDPRVVKNITEAVQALFGIDTHKIRIVKKN